MEVGITSTSVISGVSTYMGIPINNSERSYIKYYHSQHNKFVVEIKRNE